MKTIKQTWQSIYGSMDDYISSRPEKERQFWLTPKYLSIWAAVKTCPDGWWYVTRLVIVRAILPSLLTLILLVCGSAMFISFLLISISNR